MEINEYQTSVDNWIKSHGVRYFNEMTNTVLLMEELGEFARIIGRVFGEQSFKNKEEELKSREAIEDEMADILFVITCLANQMNINLEDILINNLDKKTKRDHLRHHKNKKLH